MSTRNRVLFLAVAWLIVLMPFLFWRGTWFGRPLSDPTVAQYLHDQATPRHTQHALVQIGERMLRKDPAIVKWYPELVRLSSSPVEEIRNTDAWVMGQDATRPEFHDTLLRMLQDASPLVRGNAALALVRFGDTAGHDQVVALLHATTLNAPSVGRVIEIAKAGQAVRQQGIIVQLQSGDVRVDIRTPIAGRVRSVAVRRDENVVAGTEVATLDPSSDQVWEALRALYVIGGSEDLSAIAPYLQGSADMPDRIREQAKLTDQAIRNRAGK